MKTTQDKSRYAVMFVLLVTFIGCGKPSNQSIQGHWTGSKAKDSSYSCTVSIIGNRLEYRGANSNDWARGTVVIRENMKPMEMDLTVLEPASESNHMMLAIYQIKDDKLTVAISDTMRPADFSLNGAADVANFRRDSNSISR